MNPSTQVPTCGRMVLVKYLNTAGVLASLGTLPGNVVRVLPPESPGGAPRVNVVVFGDWQTPTAGAYTLAQSLPLYDPTNPDDAGAVTGNVALADAIKVPPDAAIMRGGPWDGKPVWCEWMPYQAKKAAVEAAGGAVSGPPR